MSVMSRPASFDSGRDLTQGRDVAARKNVLGDEGVCETGAGQPADRVQQRDTIVLQAGIDGLEKSQIVGKADMLEHAD